ncbi:hypothetical protein LTS13_001433 [Exophiala xenobiotica]|nr:hypothetical protein LTR14_007671 [Exophiala xenobiotica]KAK5385798.1 hypothetical protein LTS13_001433 [Exophiala xenobiotica]KAK5406307.1 hypothetical protein LTR90_010565 [Exophiala xenobiotica]KAK5422292.1 hypothetical protein LTR06_000549 [Exophiala xenobiotica]KAK5485512.1 hypothetical protein LTR26_005870 [Exophiala xenobiotica]
MVLFSSLLILLLGGCGCVQAQAEAQNFTIINGQIFTPGLAIVDSPQPGTPEGGDSLQVAIDIAGSGRLTFPYPRDFDTGIVNITIFLFSYDTGLNLTISNGTSSGWVNASTAEPEEFDCGRSTKQGWQNAGCEEIMDQEPGSTVKHVNWAWPDCLVGNGEGGGFRGVYNLGGEQISIHEAFRANDTGFYTIFNLPIDVKNSIQSKSQLSGSGARPLCALRGNPIQSQRLQDESISPPANQPFLGGTVSSGGSGSGSGSGNGSGSQSGGESGGTNTDGKGNGAGERMVDRQWLIAAMGVIGFVVLG